MLVAGKAFRALVLLALASVYGCGPQSAPTASRPAVPVRAASAVRKDLPVRLTAIGTVEAFSTVSIKAQVDGELTRVHFSEGQDVRKGELLFSLDSRSFESELRRAEANLARDIAFEKQAEANLSRDQAQLEHARVEAGRYERLIQAGVVAREQYDQARTAMEALEASVRAGRAAIDNARESIRADRAAIENATIRLGYCTIRSPMDGRSGSLLVHPGNLVKNNDSNLVVIHRVEPIHVNFSLPEQYLAEVKKRGASGALKVLVEIPEQEGARLQGTVTFIDNAVDRSTGTIRLKATFDNRERRLWPGQFVNAELDLTSLKNAVVVPSQAIQAGQSGPFLYVIQPDLTVVSRNVTAGLSIEGETAIEKGVEAGDRVVTDGQIRLVPGATVEVKEEAVAGKETHP